MWGVTHPHGRTPMELPIDPMTLAIVGVVLLIGAAVLKKVIRLVTSVAGLAALVLALANAGALPS